MPVTITALCCIQAFLLEGRPNKSLFLTAQAAAPLFDRGVARSTLPFSVVGVQALLFAGSLLLGATASRFDPYHGGAAMNALVKSLAPLLSAALTGARGARCWLAALGSFAGIALATNFDGQWPSAHALAAYGLLLGGMVLGVVLGLVQERYGPCPWEMALGSALICAASLVLEPSPALGAELVFGVPLYGLLSLYVSRAVRDYSHSIKYDAFLFSMMLNERRAATIAIGAVQQQGNGSIRLLCGAALTLASIQVLPTAKSGRGFLLRNKEVLLRK